LEASIVETAALGLEGGTGFPHCGLPPDDPQESSATSVPLVRRAGLEVVDGGSDFSVIQEAVAEEGT
jgi:hypothetical protein